VKKSFPATLRDVLIDSHVGAATIAVMLYSSIGAAFASVRDLVEFIRPMIAAVQATDDILLSLHWLVSTFRGPIATTFLDFSVLLVDLAAAWLLSRLIYGVGPLHIMEFYRRRLRDAHV